MPPQPMQPPLSGAGILSAPGLPYLMWYGWRVAGSKTIEPGRHAGNSKEYTTTKVLRQLGVGAEKCDTAAELEKLKDPTGALA